MAYRLARFIEWACASWFVVSVMWKLLPILRVEKYPNLSGVILVVGAYSLMLHILDKE